MISPYRGYGLELVLTAVVCGSTIPYGKAAEGDKPPVREVARIEAKGEIPFLSLSPDGRRLAFEDRILINNEGKSELILVDVTTGKELRRAPFPGGGYIEAGVFSLDGKMLAIVHGKKISLWDVERWRERSTLELLSKPILGTSFAFSLDGKLLAGSVWLDTGWTLALWEVDTGHRRTLKDSEQERVNLQRPRSVNSLIYPPRAIVFADEGGPFFFTESVSGLKGAFFQQWNIRREQPANSVSLGHWLQGGTDLNRAGRGWLTPGTPVSRLRLRTAPSGQVVLLPKSYRQLPFAAVVSPRGEVALVEVPAGDWLLADPLFHMKQKEVHCFEDLVGYRGCSSNLSPDGSYLVGMGTQLREETKGKPPSLIILWEVAGLRDKIATQPAKPSGETLKEFWQDLSEREQHVRALRSMVVLAAYPEDAVALLKEKLNPPPNAKRLTQLIKDLDSEVFKTREAASAALERMGPLTQPFLKKALVDARSAELRRRLEELLEKLKDSAAGEELRFLRVIDLLEHINSSSARNLLETIAAGGWGAAYGEAAQASLLRLRRQK